MRLYGNITMRELNFKRNLCLRGFGDNRAPKFVPGARYAPSRFSQFAFTELIYYQVLLYERIASSRPSGCAE